MESDNVVYSVVFARSARKELEIISHPIVVRILKKIEALQINPRPVGCKKLAGKNSLWRLRIGDYRVVYTIDDTLRIVDISIIRHRCKVYDDLE